MAVVGLIIAGLVGVAIIIIGVLALAMPSNAAGFGIPGTRTDDPVFRSWLSVKSARDIASGVVLLALLATASNPVIGVALLGFTLAPIGDAAAVLCARGPRGAAYGIHGATAVVMLVGSFALLLG
ncbi:DUF4267 domain-containing protein [Saccharomonospora xinjiangensis]|uniref:DUF4267 domain-containing protein n=1 Tax=Saccharomonospora xinjiangensis XJ-54 TaxID=882086 RepID=I0V4T6_9PSEU|nr:DUF4267 domain-containing protein [Saccharomonospora xinjiangensis]EID55139.1 hypothetical protein SacxiDRAFT_2926 [Saccharomonospora xinjiangensis XJ-54]